MAATVVQIADAVVTTLNAASLSQAFTAERFYVPVYTLQNEEGDDELANLQVSVVPVTAVGTITDRSGRYMYEYAIDIGVQKRIGSGSMTNAAIKTACDPLMLLVEEIADVFRNPNLAGLGTASTVNAANPTIYSPQHLAEHYVFTSVVTLTFNQLRSP